MGVSVMILGVSGTGKSASMRNFAKDEVALVNVAGKPLPFKGRFSETLNSDDYDKIKDFISGTDKKSVVIDDAQYLIGNEYMRRALEKGYDKFTELAKNFFDLLTFIQGLPDERIVYLLGHLERDQDGNEKFKTMGKLIDQCINVEGTCTIVLKTCVSDGKYTFLTQNSGKDTVKSPMGMFDSFAIENDLKYVDDKIRNYYEFDGAVSDADMQKKDKAAASDVTKDDAAGKKRRSSRAKKDKPTEQPEVQAHGMEGFMNILDGTDEEIPFDSICTTDTYFYIEADDNYVVKHAEEMKPDGGKEISREEFNAGLKRIAQEGNPSIPEPAPADATPGTPTRRTRRKRA